jgi:hypothetical protein
MVVKSLRASNKVREGWLKEMVEILKAWTRKKRREKKKPQERKAKLESIFWSFKRMG